MTQRAQRASRRNFLLVAGAGSAAAAAAIVSRKPASTVPVGKDKTATRGYQATEHVNNYYRTAKV